MRRKAKGRARFQEIIRCVGYTALLMSVFGFAYIMHSKKMKYSIPIPYTMVERITSVEWLTETEIQNISSKTYTGYIVDASGNLTQRIAKFNAALLSTRSKLVADPDFSKWDDFVLNAGNDPVLIWGAIDNYIEIISKNYSHIMTIALPWANDDRNLSRLDGGPLELLYNGSEPMRKWDSTDDYSNVLIQNYYQWTGDETLCKWIETPGVIKMKYDAVFNRQCSRNQTLAALRPTTLEPVFLNGKPLNPHQYWPNGGNSFPLWFYTDTPDFVFHMHIHRDAVLDDIGDVFSGNTVLALYSCRNIYQPPTASLPIDAGSKPIYDEASYVNVSTVNKVEVWFEIEWLYLSQVLAQCQSTLSPVLSHRRPPSCPVTYRREGIAVLRRSIEQSQLSMR